MELRELLDKKVALDAEIHARKGEAVAAIRELMSASGVTVEDLTPPAARGAGVKRPVKYRDGENTWTGVGQRPRWVQKALAAGAPLDQFKV